MAFEDHCGPIVRGQPLYRYALSEMDEEVVSAELTRDFATGHADALFCVYASRWFSHREPKGAWTWRRLKRDLGLAISDDELRGHVAKGLADLGIVPRERSDGGPLWLFTLACESGLPLARLERHDAAVSRFLRALCEKFGAMGLRDYSRDGERMVEVARRVQVLLPRTLRDETVRSLSAELVGRMWSLISELQLHASASASEARTALDQREPQWQERLPLRLGDRLSQLLIERLIHQTVQVYRSNAYLPTALSIATEMFVEGATKKLIRRLVAPTLIEAGSFEDAFDGTPPPLGRLRVSKSGDGTDTTCARFRCTSAGFIVDIVPGHGLSSSGQIVVEAVRGIRRPVRAKLLDGGADLGSLPWVFRKPGLAAVAGTWRWVTAGSCSAVDERLLVAAPGDWACAHPDLKPLSGAVCGRKLFLLESVEVDFRRKDEVVKIRAGAAVGDHSGFLLHGVPLPSYRSRRGLLYARAPTLRRRDTAGSIHTTKHDREWLTGGPESGGVLLVSRRNAEGHLVFEQTVDVAPPGFSITLEPGPADAGGAVHLHTTGSPTGLEVVSKAWDVTRLGDFAIRVRPTRADVPNRLWLGIQVQRGVLDVSIPAPILRASIVDVEGIELGRGVRVPLWDIDRWAFEVVGALGQQRLHVELQGFREQYSKGKVTRSPATGCWTESLRVDGVLARRSLADLRPWIERLMAIVGTLDGLVTLRLPPPHDEVRVDVYRYPEAFLRHGRGPYGLSLRNHDQVDVSLRRFTNPYDSRVVPRARGQWRVRFRGDDAGAYLAVGRSAGRVIARPLRLMAPREDPGRTPLQRALEIRNERHRLDRLRDVLRSLSLTPRVEDWALLDAFIGFLGDLPAATFDVLRTLPDAPVALAACMLRGCEAGDERMQRMLDGLAELSLHWWEIRAADIEQACALYLEFDEDAEAQLENLVDAALCLASFVPALGAMVWLSVRQLGYAGETPVEMAKLLDRDRQVHRRRVALASLVRSLPSSWTGYPRVLPPLTVEPLPAIGDDSIDMLRDAPLAAAGCALGRLALTPRQVDDVARLRLYDPQYFEEVAEATCLLELLR